MKFTKGYWMNLPGVTNTDAVQVREVKVENDRVYLYTVPYHADMRAMGGPLLEMYISSPQPDIIRTEAYHFMGSNQKMPAFELNDAHCALEVENTETTVTIKSGNTKLIIGKNPCSFDYYYKDKKLTSIGNRFGNAMISTVSTPDGNYMRAQMNLDIGEKVYGLGERFTPYVKNGQTVETWNEDGGTCTEISYKSIPFYITNRNYGVLVNDPGPVSYEICSEHVTRVQFSVPGEKLDFMVVGGDSMKNVLENYTTLSGKPALPPAWTFGLWLTSSFTTKYDEETVMGFVNGMKERHIPLHVFHFDCYWMKENEWCNFDWDRAMFPDIEHQLQVMKHENNLKICVWINTYIGQKSPLFKEAKELGYLLKSRTATFGSGICGRPAWVSWTSRTRVHGSGISPSCATCSTRASIASRPTSVRESRPMLSTMTAAIRSVCTTITPTFTISAFGKCLRSTRARTRHASLQEAPRSADRSSRYTGAATARRTTPPCPNPCAAAFPCAFPASASGATT